MPNMQTYLGDRNGWCPEMVSAYSCITLKGSVFQKYFLFRTCDPVYDESCKTHYPQKCSYKKKCPHTCADEDCSTDPYKAKYCKRIKYCSRKPHTTCTPVKRNECSMKKYLSPKKVRFIKLGSMLIIDFAKMYIYTILVMQNALALK